MLMRIITIILFIAFSLNISAQDNQIAVKRSTQKVFINGKKYYLHTVQQGETLYSISKAYNLQTKDIAIENTDVFDGIQPDQTLKIPIIAGINSTEEEILSAGKYIVHTVEAGQTLYSISKKYDVSIEEIKAENPFIVDGIKVGHLIRIPKPKEDKIATAFNEPVKVDDGDKDGNFFYHEVEKKQTLYSIAKMYNVEIDDILKLNPEVAKDGLKAGVKIKIPKSNQDIIQVENYSANENKVVDTLKFVQQMDSLIQQEISQMDSAVMSLPCDSVINPIIDRPIHVALFLPFYTDKNKNIEIEKMIKKDEDFFPNSHFIEFYEGVLLALDTLRKEGKKVVLQVYDTKNDSATIANLLVKPELKNIDLIIGPSYYDEFIQVSSFAKENNIYIVSPFLSKQEILNQNPFVFQVIPSITTQLYYSIKKIVNKYKSNNLIYVTNSDIEKDKLSQVYKKMLNTFVSEVDSSVLLKEIQCSEHIIKQIEDALSVATENVIFVPCTDQAYISNLISTISLNTKDYKVTIIGLPVWTKFENIELEYFHRTNLHSFQPTYVDYNDSTTLDFIREYHFMFKHEPIAPFSFLGYDITRYFVKTLADYGKHFANCMPYIKYPTLSSDFLFIQKNIENGFENQSVKVINYNREFGIDLVK